MPRDQTPLRQVLPRCAFAAFLSKSPVICPLLRRELRCSSERSTATARRACTRDPSIPTRLARWRPRHLRAANFPNSLRSDGSVRGYCPIPARPRACSHQQSAAAPWHLSANSRRPPQAPRNPGHTRYSPGSRAAVPFCPVPLSRARSRFASLSIWDHSPPMRLLALQQTCFLRPLQLATPQAAPRASSTLRHAAIRFRGIAQFRVLPKIQISSCKVSSRCHGLSKSVYSQVHGVIAKYVLVVRAAQITCRQSVHCFSAERHLQIQPLKVSCGPPV